MDLSNNAHAPEITFVAEGIETALSIKDSLSNSEQSRSKILVSLGKSNLNNLLTINSSNNIALVLDDDKQDWKQDLAMANRSRDIKLELKRAFTELGKKELEFSS